MHIQEDLLWMVEEIRHQLVDGQHPMKKKITKICSFLIFTNSYQLMQDFFHPRATCGNPTRWLAWFNHGIMGAMDKDVWLNYGNIKFKPPITGTMDKHRVKHISYKLL